MKVTEGREKETNTEASNQDPKLLSCPFCGSDDGPYFQEIYDDTGRLVKDAYRVDCQNCQIEFSCGDSWKDEIARLWNRRVSVERQS